MSLSQDYPRMLFHRRMESVIVHSREEEDALGPEWSRRIWPIEAEEPAQAAITEAAAELKPDPPGPETEPEEKVSPVPPHRPAKPHTRIPAPAKIARKKR